MTSLGRHPTYAGSRQTGKTVLRGAGQLLLTAAVVIFLFAAYELWWTGFTTRHDQHVLLKTLHTEWANGQLSKNPPLGTGIAVLRVPRFGHNWAFVVVQGTSTADLIKGPGHYVGSAMPGQVGNFAVAGHRTTYLHPFYDINDLRVGDPIVVETGTTWFTYRVEDIPGTHAKYQEVVSPSDVTVAYPVPDQPNASAIPTQRVLTFTSCNPRYSASQRMVVHALLVSQQPKSQGLPPALAGYRLAGGS